MKLSVITVTHQSREHIDSCILSIFSHTIALEYEHIIVDNASTDGTTRLIEEGFANYVTLIKSEKNIGFAAANNLGLEHATGEMILFLNPDMQIVEGYLDELVLWMGTQENVGIASCKLLSFAKNCCASLRPIRFPSLGALPAAFLNRRSFACAVNRDALYPDFDDEKERAVDAVRGSFMLMKRDTIEKIGGAFDEKYFILFEDLDLCRRVRQMGYKILYTPQISCIDYQGQSFSQVSKAWKYRQICKSLKTYVRRWHSPYHLIWLNLMIPLGSLLRIREWQKKSC